MAKHTFTQLLDIKQIQSLMESYNKVTGLLSAILDTNEKVLVAAGWQDICVRFHRQHPVTLDRCKESEAYIKKHLHNYEGRFLEYKCRNGLRDMAMPIFFDGEHLATFFFGQCFYEDDNPDPEFFRHQAREFGFDENKYLEALQRVPIYSREQMRNALDLYSNLMKIITEMGTKKLKLIQEIEAREKVSRKMRESREYTDRIINSILDEGGVDL
ncbi:MAG: PocR ligand-binding domain-containing protein [Geobacteraceae bacterium]|nr:PocR ligand-binding domain-containing protein [Geobacteraceae bacterium]